jgi:hypothetical protein
VAGAVKPTESAPSSEAMSVIVGADGSAKGVSGWDCGE